MNYLREGLVNLLKCVSCKAEFWDLATKKKAQVMHKRSNLLVIWPYMTGHTTQTLLDEARAKREHVFRVRHMSDSSLRASWGQARLWNNKVTSQADGFNSLGMQDFSEFLNGSWITGLSANFFPLSVEIILRATRYPLWKGSKGPSPPPVKQRSLLTGETVDLLGLILQPCHQWQKVEYFD